MHLKNARRDVDIRLRGHNEVSSFHLNTYRQIHGEQLLVFFCQRSHLKAKDLYGSLSHVSACLGVRSFKLQSTDQHVQFERNHLDYADFAMLLVWTLPRNMQ